MGGYSLGGSGQLGTKSVGLRTTGDSVWGTASGGQCLGGQCLEGQCLEGQCLEGQCLGGSCLPLARTESRISNFFLACRTLICRGKNSQKAQAQVTCPGGSSSASAPVGIPLDMPGLPSPAHLQHIVQCQVTEALPREGKGTCGLLHLVGTVPGGLGVPGQGELQVLAHLVKLLLGVLELAHIPGDQGSQMSSGLLPDPPTLCAPQVSPGAGLTLGRSCAAVGAQTSGPGRTGSENKGGCWTWSPPQGGPAGQTNTTHRLPRSYAHSCFQCPERGCCWRPRSCISRA